MYMLRDENFADDENNLSVYKYKRKWEMRFSVVQNKKIYIFMRF